MQIAFSLPLNSFDATLLRETLEAAILRCKVQGKRRRLKNILEVMALAEADAVEPLSRPPDKD